MSLPTPGTDLPELPNGNFLRQLLEESPAMMLITDAQAGDHPIIYVNTAFEAATGYSRAEVIGKNPRFLQNDDREQEALSIVRAALRDGGECTVTLRNYHKDGTLFYNEIRIRPLRNASGQVTHHMGVQNDVTERVLAQLALARRQSAALQESELRYRALIENFPNGLIALYDHDLRYVVVNGEGIVEIGFRPSDLEGKRLRDVFPSEVYERDEPALLAALNGERTESEVALGNQYFRVITAPVRDDDGNVVNGLIVSQNITARVRAKQAVREAANRYQTILSSMAEGVILYDETGTALMCNESAQAIFGVPEEAIIDVSIPEIFAHDTWTNIDEDGNTLTLADYPVMVTLRTGEPQTNIIMGFKADAHAAPLWLSVNTQPLMSDEEAKPYGVVTTFTDITEQRRMQAQVINNAIHQAQLKLLANFIRSTSHELRTPLSVISTSAYFLRRSDDATQRARHADKVTDQIKRLTTLIDKLLLMSKLDSGVGIEPQPVRLGEVCEVAVNEVASLVDEKAHTLQVEVNDVQLSGDPDYLVTMLVELLKNACHHTPTGGAIGLWSWVDEEQALIGVDDTGIGIATEDLPYIFDHFWRKDESHSKSGFGLGLAAVKRIVDLHHGTITVESRPDEGTWFRVRLPVRP